MTKHADVLFVNSLGPGFTLATARGPQGLGGSELEIVQIAHALARRGHKVVVANGVTETTEEEGVIYMPLQNAHGMRCDALWVERSTTPPRIETKRVVVRATDQNGSWYDMHKPLLANGRAAVAVNGAWHASLFPEAKEKIIIPPALDFDVGGLLLLPTKEPRQFVYASAPMKGLGQTLETWRHIQSTYFGAHKTGLPIARLQLKVIVPGFSDMHGDKALLRDDDAKFGITYEGMPSLTAWRRAIAEAEGLFFVNTLMETYGCVAAFAEKYGTRTHILCLGEIAGFADSVTDQTYVTKDRDKFIKDFVQALGKKARYPERPDQSPDALAAHWEEALHLPTKSWRAAPITTPRPEATYDARAMGILEEFKSRLIGLATDTNVTGTATPYWMERAKALTQIAKTAPTKDFLRWTNDFDHEDASNYHDDYKQLVAHPEWERWKKLTRVAGWGNPHAFALDAGTAPVPTQHARTLMEYERQTGGRLTDDIDVVVEFGGGYGNFARMLRADGYEGPHIIIDLPHTREFQRAFLQLHQVPLREGLPLDALGPGVHLCIEKDIPAILESVRGKRVAFVAMWSLSEVPLELRAKLFPTLHASCAKYLIQSQWPHHVKEPHISNEAYFIVFMNDAPAKFSNRWVPVEKGYTWPARNLFAPVLVEHHDGPAASAAISAEQKFEQEELPDNKPSLGPQFGQYLSHMRSAISSGGSEYGLGLMLMSLTASTRATCAVEIGRFQGFSTIAIAAGLALADAGWQEPTFARQRPDVDYDRLLAKKKRTLFTIDNCPTKEADDIIASAALGPYIEKIDQASDGVDPARFGPIDLLLIDGNHELPAVRRDVARYVPYVRPGGYFILHDYFGWYQNGVNGSPIKQVIDEDLKGFEQLLLDTGFASFVIFRKTAELFPVVKKAPPRKDGRPTVGLVLIAKGDEASTVIARAIVSVSAQVDAITVVSDGGNQTVDVCRALGADVHLRPTPDNDWVNGDGFITRARNEALAIAEQKTDYVLMLDPDDRYEGEIPNELTADAYQIFVHDGGMKYSRPQLYKASRGFRYRGVVHEVLHVPSGTVSTIESLKYIRHHGGHQDRSMDPRTKYMKHARMLERWLFDHPEDTRSQFYLAQSYRDAREYDKAIAAYKRRIDMTTGGWDEERAFSAAQIARILRETGKDPTEWYLRAYELRPTRAEPLCELANWLRDDKQKRFDLAVMVASRAAKIPIPKGDALFMVPTVYEFGALEELAIALYWSGDKAQAKTTYEEILPRVPKAYRPHIEAMIALCVRDLGAGK